MAERYLEWVANAKTLHQTLTNQCKSNTGYLSFFCSMPSTKVMVTEAYKDALLVALVANALEKYDKSIAEKLSVLIGVYVYFYERYNVHFLSQVSRNFLNLLKNDLTDNAVDAATFEKKHAGLRALSLFCGWVYEDKDSDPELKKLYDRFQNAMQATILEIQNKINKEKEASRQQGGNGILCGAQLF